jgi:hypothetical protein
LLGLFLNIETTRKNNKDHTFQINDVPGPGSYDFSSTQHKASGKKLQRGFGVSKRGDMIISKTGTLPGPGNYEIPSSMENKKGCTLKSRHVDYEFKKRMLLPGPGRYNVSDYISKKIPTLNMRKDNAKLDSLSMTSNSTIPGPGAYEPRSESIRKSPSKWKIGTAGRNVINSKSILTPGPGSYNTDEKEEKKRKGVMF